VTETRRAQNREKRQKDAAREAASVFLAVRFCRKFPPEGVSRPDHYWERGDPEGARPQGRRGKSERNRKGGTRFPERASDDWAVGALWGARSGRRRSRRREGETAAGRMIASPARWSPCGRPAG
jgi:hypothetical protein